MNTIHGKSQILVKTEAGMVFAIEAGGLSVDVKFEEGLDQVKIRTHHGAKIVTIQEAGAKPVAAVEPPVVDPPKDLEKVLVGLAALISTLQQRVVALESVKHVAAVDSQGVDITQQDIVNILERHEQSLVDLSAKLEKVDRHVLHIANLEHTDILRGPKGEPGPKGDKGDKGEPGPMGIPGRDNNPLVGPGVWPIGSPNHIPQAPYPGWPQTWCSTTLESKG